MNSANTAASVESLAVTSIKRCGLAPVRLTWNAMLLWFQQSSWTCKEDVHNYWNKLVFVKNAVGWRSALQSGMPRVRFPIVSLGFFIDLILPDAIRPWSTFSHWQIWELGVSPGGLRRPVHKADDLNTFMYRLSRNSDSLNLLQP